MSLAKNKGIIRRYFEECLNQGNMETIDELISPTYISHYPAGYELGGGPDDVKQIVSSVRRGFPNVHFTIEDFISQGEKVVGTLDLPWDARRKFHGRCANEKRGSWSRVLQCIA